MKFEASNFCEIDKIQDCNVIVGENPCFTKNSLILTWDGYKPLKDIQIGDNVLSHDGAFYPVTDILQQGKKSIVKVRSAYFSTICTTDNHPFYAKTRNTEPKWVEVKNLTSDHYIGIPIGFKSENRSKIPEAALYARGLYLRFGHKTIGDSIVLKIPVEYKEQIRKKLYSLDIPFSVSELKLSNGYLLFNLYFLKNVFNFNIFDLSRADTEILLSGCIDCLPETVDIVSDKIDAIYNIAYLFAKCYRKPCKFERDLDRNYVIKLHHNLSDYYVKSNYIWYPVDVIFTKDCDEVFDLTVEDSHSFVAQNCIVHNCAMKGGSLCRLK